MKNPLSKQMTALLTVFALGGGVVTQTDILNQFLNEKEGNRLTAYLDSEIGRATGRARGVRLV